jgi:hypothetical protein
VSDDPTQADEADATEQGSGGDHSHEQDRSWLQGDPDPDRLVSYATNLRKERAELKERLAKADVWEDEDAVFEKVREKFPHWLEADEQEPEEQDDDEFDEDDPHAAQLRELAERQKKHDEWIAQQNAEREAARFDADLKRFVGDRDISDKAERAIRLEAATGKLGPKELQTLVDDWVAYEGTLRQSGIEQLKSSKKAPHVPAGGNAGRGPQPDMTTSEGRAEFFKQRMAGGGS